MSQQRDEITDSNASGLLIYVPGIQYRPGNSRALLDALAKEPKLKDWQIETYAHQIGLFSRMDVAGEVRKLAARIRSWAGENGESNCPENIILVGHSLGGLLVRDALMLDSDRQTAEGRVVPGVTPWTERVSRVVLLASPNRGYVLDNLDPLQRRLAKCLSMLGAFMVEHFEAGSEYITDLRLRWFEFIGNLEASDRAVNPSLEVVQLLGDRDEVISQSDILDPEFMRNAAALTVPDSGHDDLIDISSGGTLSERYEYLRRAVLGSVPEMSDLREESPHPVVFIIHGIRSSKSEDWVSLLKNLVLAPANGSAGTFSESDIVTPTYGYFGSIDFAKPWIRRRNTRNLLMWYSDKFITHNPNNMYFAGHSNGTYMLGRCLLKVPSMRFRRIYLAASVLPKNYDWNKVVGRLQVGHYTPGGTWMDGRIHSDGARHDVPVGILASILSGTSPDIGTGGFSGFDQYDAVLTEHVRSYEGGHGNMLEPKASREEKALVVRKRLTEIAEFIRSGADHEAPPAKKVLIFSLVSRVLGVVFRPWMILGLVALAAAIIMAAPLPIILLGGAAYLLVIINQA